MSPGKGLPDFPNVEAKLQKPARQSAFEKQRAEAEAKRQREAAEAAAALEDFVKSFDDDDNDEPTSSDLPPPWPRPGFSSTSITTAAGPSRRHFGTSALKSGPGSLGPPPTSFGKKRSFQDFSRGPKEKTAFGPEQPRGAAPSISKAFDTSDDEDMAGTADRAEEKAIAKPTLRLSNLPPGTSPSMIKALMPSSLTVENVKILPPAGPGGSLERKCVSAIVTFSQETPANELDGAVSALQNRYLGYGYYLSLHRHLSSAVASSTAIPGFASLTSTTQPFGAKSVEQNKPSLKSSAQQGPHRGFAPPSSYEQPLAPVNRNSLLHVPVQPPQEIRTIQLISKVIEGLLEHGPGFEALLMSRPEVQRDEKWAWIWDARSHGGVWYRWKLWEIVSGSQPTRSKGKFLPLFDGSHAWKSPDVRLAFEYTTHLDDFASDSDYNSSDEDDMGGEETREAQGAEAEKTFLNPLEKAKLTHLLARLPKTLSKIRKGDIARVTTFAITHASRGADEVVDLIVSNIEQPFSLTNASGDKRQDSKAPVQHGAGTDDAVANEALDTSGASLVGLYAISDILSSSSTSGVRHAWRFRQLFETALRDRKVFEGLGSMADRLGWGRMRADKWKRSVTLVLNLWEGWCVFPAESQEHFVSTFESPPSLKTENKAEAEDMLKRGRWKVVERTTDTGRGLGDEADGEEEERKRPHPSPPKAQEGWPDGFDARTLQGDIEKAVEGAPINEDNLQGEPMDEDERQEVAATSQVAHKGVEVKQVAGEVHMIPASTSASASPGRPQPRKRMRAVDMFADSDNSE